MEANFKAQPLKKGGTITQFFNRGGQKRLPEEVNGGLPKLKINLSGPGGDQKVRLLGEEREFGLQRERKEGLSASIDRLNEFSYKGNERRESQKSHSLT